jgi:hypothetical protein
MPAGRLPRVKGFIHCSLFCESFAIARSSSGQQPNRGGEAMKWTLVRYKARPDQAEENQRLSAAVFGELQQKAPAGLHYAVFRLPDDTFVHLASLEDGATPLSALETFRVFSSGVRERCLEPPVAVQPVLVGNYGMLAANKIN